ncbi:hypothetical protein EKL29_09285 [Pantoea sp. YU22]|uniref:Uncharacterized protein n=1 Tax=Pantoea piersonii TaxID=2364647 RepID=A0AAJ5QPI3_9GAMM|nr:MULTISPECIES: hypothetical protein [Pantoea]RTY58344.1 hypothetical protein EKL29_09285 [Pantoea sp. YU22]WBG93384.1 hypothetical protein N5580_21775 [Pantoea piersonii]
MSETIQILQIFLSWPAVFIICMIIMFNPIRLLLKRLAESNTAKAKLGFVEIEIGELAKKGKAAVDSINELNLIMAKTRLLELEVTKANFSMSFTGEEQLKLNGLILDLKKNIDHLEREII